MKEETSVRTRATRRNIPEDAILLYELLCKIPFQYVSDGAAFGMWVTCVSALLRACVFCFPELVHNNGRLCSRLPLTTLSSNWSSFQNQGLHDRHESEYFLHHSIIILH
jgi:hypothetical protein